MSESLRAMIGVLDVRAADEGMPSYGELEERLVAAQSEGDQGAQVAVLHDMGIRLRTVGTVARSLGSGPVPSPLNPDEALEAAFGRFEEALELAESVGAPGIICFGLQQLAALHLELSRPERAAECLRAASQRCGADVDATIRYSIRRDLGDALLTLEDDLGAVEQYQAALVEAQEIDDPFEQATTLGKIGSAQGNLKRFGEAVASYQAARDLFTRIGAEEELRARISLHRNLFHPDGIPSIVMDLDNRIEREQDRERRSLALAALGRAHSVRYRHATHYEALLRAFGDPPEREETEARRPSFGDERAQIRNGQRWAAENSERYEVAAELLIDYGLAAPAFLDARVPAADRLKWTEAALAAAERRGDARARVRLLVGTAYNLSAMGEATKAIERAGEAEALARSSDDSHGEGSAQLALSAIYSNLGRSDDALRVLQEGRKRVPDVEAVRRADLSLLTLIHLSRGEYEAGLDYGSRELEQARERSDRSREAKALGNLGLIRGDMGDYAGALEHHLGALAISRELNERAAESSNLANAGVAYLELDRLEEAFDHLQQALVIARELGDRSKEEGALGNLGHVLRTMERYEEAVRYFDEASRIAADRGHLLGEANACQGMGNVYLKRGDYQSALKSYERALEIAVEISNPHAEVGALLSLGNAQSLAGRPAQALKLFQRCLDRAREIGDQRTEGDAMINLSATLGGLGRFPEALLVAAATKTHFERLGLADRVAHAEAAQAMLRDAQRRAEPRTTHDATSSLLQSWLGIPTVDVGDSRAFIEKHQEALLTDEAIEILESMSDNKPQDGKLARHVQLLQDARTDGIDTAFERYAPQVAARVAVEYERWRQTPEAEAVMEKIVLWATQPDSESSKAFFLANQADLLTVNTMTSLALASSAVGPEAAPFQHAHRLFTLIRKQGVESAYADFESPLWH